MLLSSLTPIFSEKACMKMPSWFPLFPFHLHPLIPSSPSACSNSFRTEAGNTFCREPVVAPVSLWKDVFHNTHAVPSHGDPPHFRTRDFQTEHTQTFRPSNSEKKKKTRRHHEGATEPRRRWRAPPGSCRPSSRGRRPR